VRDPIHEGILGAFCTKRGARGPKGHGDVLEKVRAVGGCVRLGAGYALQARLIAAPKCGKVLVYGARQRK
jgi:hypothetical protein